MTPQTIALVIGLVEEIATHAPQAYADLKAMLAKPEPTAGDWLQLRSRVLSQSYAQLVPNSDLPK